MKIGAGNDAQQYSHSRELSSFMAGSRPAGLDSKFTGRPAWHIFCATMLQRGGGLYESLRIKPDPPIRRHRNCKCPGVNQDESFAAEFECEPIKKAPMSEMRVVVALTNARSADYLPGRCGIDQGRTGYRRLQLPLAATRRLGRRCGATHRPILRSYKQTPSLSFPHPASRSGIPRYVCYLAGSLRTLVSTLIEGEGTLVTNWGGSISRRFRNAR